MSMPTFPAPSTLLFSLFWMTGASMALGQEVPAQWSCAACDPGPGWTLDLALAPAYVADDAYRFGDYTGLDDKGAYLFGAARGEYVDDKAGYFYFDGHALNPDFTGLFVEGGRQGRYEVRGAYQSIPRRFYDAALTPFSGSGSDLLALPDDWVRAPVTGAMSALPESLEPVSIGRDLDVLKLGMSILPSSRWKIDADYRRQTKKGRSLSSGSFLFSAAEFTSPVDYTTDDLELGLSFSGEGWQTQLRYLGSYFDNGNDRLTWQNPFSAVPGADNGNQSLAPDNELHQISLGGALRLPKRTVFSGQLAFGMLSQDEKLEPYTLNQLIATSPLPRASADADADTLNLNLRAVSSPWRRVTVEGELRYNRFDNEKPANDYDHVITDSIRVDPEVRNLAYDYERTELKLRAEYRPGRRLKLHAGIDSKRFERNAQDRSRTDTDKFWFRLHQRLGDTADLDFDLFTEQRDGDGYDPQSRLAGEQNPLMRKYNLSDRSRYGIRLKGSVFPAERWDFGWELEYGEDDYTETDIGLTGSSYARVGLDLSWLIGRQGSLYSNLYTETVDAIQANSQRFSDPDWTATTTDHFDGAVVGFDHPALIGSLGMNVSYTFSRGRGETVKNTSGLEDTFPDLNSRRHRLDLELTYPLGESWTLGFNYLYESVRSDDWALDGLDPDTLPNLLSMSADPFNYEVNVIYLSFRYLRPPG